MTRWKRNFSNSDWAKTPDAVKEDFIRLEETVILLVKKIKEIEKELHQLKSRMNKNSTNSDKPPSSDSPYRYPSKKNKKGRSGAKMGHKGHKQELLDPTEIIPLLPEACKCGSRQFENIRPFYTHQEIEFPEIQMDITHFILHKGECAGCGETIKAILPKEHRTGYGFRLSALIGNIAGIQGNSRTTVQEFCRSVLKFNISLGAIQKVIDRVSEAIQPHYQTIANRARQSDINGIDETPWKEKGVLHYLWAMVNPEVAFFKIHKERSKKAFLALIEDWKGILISDGYNVYQKWLFLRQTCLAHLIRAAKGLAEHQKQSIGQFGEQATEMLQQLCNMAKNKPSEKEWNDFYSGFIDLICDNCARHYDEAGKFARRLLREFDSLWVFLEVAGVEPTNNNTERSLRYGVMWRKRSQGTRGDKGNRWVERILTLRQTAKLRNLSGFDILVNAMNDYFKEQNPDLSWI